MHLKAQRYKRCVALLILAGIAGAQQKMRSVWDGVYTQEQADRGEGLYAAQCASCHGDELQGIDVAGPLSGGDFIYNWNGQPLSKLFERIHRDMPDNENRGTLSRETASELLAFILRFNGFPAGRTPLSTRDEVLKTIGIEAKK